MPMFVYTVVLNTLSSSLSSATTARSESEGPQNATPVGIACILSGVTWEVGRVRYGGCVD